MPDLAATIHANGWAVVESVIDPMQLTALSVELESSPEERGRSGGRRNLLDLPGVRNLARTSAVRAVAEAVLGPYCAAVRGIYFDKGPHANWKVPWHQDLTIAVAVHREVNGFGPWSEKAGVPHVQAPAAILERMLAVRIHIDDCGAESGPVRVLPGSHRSGVLGSAEIEDWKLRAPAIDCTVSRGGILAFRPLVLHSSLPATQPARRRVIHLEFAGCHLTQGLEWRWMV